MRYVLYTEKNMWRNQTCLTLLLSKKVFAVISLRFFYSVVQAVVENTIQFCSKAMSKQRITVFNNDLGNNCYSHQSNHSYFFEISSEVHLSRCISVISKPISKSFKTNLVLFKSRFVDEYRKKTSTVSQERDVIIRLKLEYVIS